MPTENIITEYTTYDLIDDKKKATLMEKLLTISPEIILGNPPYQNEAVGEQKTFNEPTYNHFMDAAYIVSGVVEMIHPARFLSNAGGTPKPWNKKMLGDRHLSIKSYKGQSDKVFADTEIKGGVAISLRDKFVDHEPVGVFTPYPELNSIMRKVVERNDFTPMSSIVVTRTAYRFTKLMHDENPTAAALLSKGHLYDVSTNVFERLPQIFFDTKPDDGHKYVRILGRANNERTYKYVRRDYLRPVINLDSYKVLLTKSNGAGSFGETLTPQFVEGPAVANTETFISLGNFHTAEEATNVKTYLSTRFAMALLGAKKTTQDISPEKWMYVPMQNFTPSSDIDWTKTVGEIDEQLYGKYRLDKSEKDFLNSNVKPME